MYSRKYDCVCGWVGVAVKFCLFHFSTGEPIGAPPSQWSTPQGFTPPPPPPPPPTSGVAPPPPPPEQSWVRSPPSLSY